MHLKIAFIWISSWKKIQHFLHLANLVIRSRACLCSCLETCVIRFSSQVTHLSFTTLKLWFSVQRELLPFTTVPSKVRRNSVPAIHKSLPLIIPTFTQSVIFLPGDESDMSWHAMFIIKLPFVIGTLHPKGLFEVIIILNFTVKGFFYRDTISKSQIVSVSRNSVLDTKSQHNFSVEVHLSLTITNYMLSFLRSMRPHS